MAPKALHLPHPNSPPYLLLYLQCQGPPNGLEYDEKVLHLIGNEVLKVIVAQFHVAQLLIEHPSISALVCDSLVRHAKDFNIILDDVAVTHLSYGSEFSKAVEQK
ncbi:hypothetical protein ACSBR2_015169 [Camellia fascicularis]